MNKHDIEYDSIYEMRSDDMHCKTCGMSGCRSDLEKGECRTRKVITEELIKLEPVWTKKAGLSGEIHKCAAINFENIAIEDKENDNYDNVVGVSIRKLNDEAWLIIHNESRNKDGLTRIHYCPYCGVSLEGI